ncbi:hypothetical protein JRI60_15300 [Archangium violaceum]|uniref:hypothetical protein n=1 Tax=Archangium violaceum TaxID=83451 RepID=UPI001951B64F|nr:hypothetical protein [Archangium violaceum]QRO00289.1 hypothetical protein JRI60_15300 [Archangium violaceum]
MESHQPKVCPRCGEPRILAPECPRCGVLYAKAEARAAQLAARAAPPPPVVEEPQALPALAFPEPERPPHLPAETLSWRGDLDDARDELRLHQFALPVALAVAWLLMQSSLPRALLRTFLSMWIHELGHAVSAWFCGFPAIPGPWFTPIWGERSNVVFVLLAASLGALIFRGYLSRSRVLMIAGATGLVLQFVCTVGLSISSARQLFTFGGDGGCLVIGSLLMVTLYAPRDSALRRGWLHWGYLVIGAVSFMDAFTEWWAARSNLELIPFGMNEGSGLSDPSVLADTYGWSEMDLVRRYTWLGLACLAVLAVVYAVGLRRTRAALRALERQHGA